MPGYEKGYRRLGYEQEIVRGPLGEILTTRGRLPTKERDMPKKKKSRYTIAVNGNNICVTGDKRKAKTALRVAVETAWILGGKHAGVTIHFATK